MAASQSPVPPAAEAPARSAPPSAPAPFAQEVAAPALGGTDRFSASATGAAAAQPRERLAGGCDACGEVISSEAGSSSEAERQLSKLKVAGSIPASRSSPATAEARPRLAAGSRRGARALAQTGSNPKPPNPLEPTANHGLALSFWHSRGALWPSSTSCVPHASGFTASSGRGLPGHAANRGGAPGRQNRQRALRGPLCASVFRGSRQKCPKFAIPAPEASLRQSPFRSAN